MWGLVVTSFLMAGMGVSLEESMLSSMGDTVSLSCWENLGMEPSSGARGAPGAAGLCVRAALRSWPFTRLLWPECNVKDPGRSVRGPHQAPAPGGRRRGAGLSVVGRQGCPQCRRCPCSSRYRGGLSQPGGEASARRLTPHEGGESREV